MIHVFFVPGMFGSTLEYVLSSFTKELNPIKTTIMWDGSMHGFEKQAHFSHPMVYEQFFKTKTGNCTDNTITTPIYPYEQTHLVDILPIFNQYRSKSDSYILVHAGNIEEAELNLLFQYNKLADGFYQRGLAIFCGENQHNITQWNTDYTHWSEMAQWQLREWFSLFYPDWVQEWIASAHEVDNKFNKITNREIVTDPYVSFSKLIKLCQLTEQGNLYEFSQYWASKQSYILDQFWLLDTIVSNTINDVEFKWDPINVIAESIIQQRLRTKGFEIRCDGLNVFPTDSKTLYTLLEKIL